MVQSGRGPRAPCLRGSASARLPHLVKDNGRSQAPPSSRSGKTANAHKRQEHHQSEGAGQQPPQDRHTQHTGWTQPTGNAGGTRPLQTDRHACWGLRVISMCYAVSWGAQKKGARGQRFPETTLTFHLSRNSEMPITKADPNVDPDIEEICW